MNYLQVSIDVNLPEGENARWDTIIVFITKEMTDETQINVIIRENLYSLGYTEYKNIRWEPTPAGNLWEYFDHVIDCEGNRLQS